MKATSEMKRVANSDEPVAKYDWFGKPYTAYKHSLFFACKKYHSILKIAIFHPADLRAGRDGAKYELYIDLSAPDFITYEPGNGRWYKSCLGNGYFYGVNKHGNEVWCSERDTENLISQKLLAEGWTKELTPPGMKPWDDFYGGSSDTIG